MVDILEASGAKAPKPGLAATPASTQSEAQIAAPYVEFGSGLRKLGEALGTLGERVDMAAVPEAQAAGLSAVGRDAKGEPTVELKPFAISKSDVAFNHAATQGFLSQWQMDAQRGLQEIAARNQSDPAAFDKESAAYVRTLGAGAKELRPLVQAEAGKLRQQHFLTIQNHAVQRQTAQAKDSILVQIESTTNDIFAMSRQGGTGTPDFAAAQDRLTGLYTQLKGNPLFGVAPDRADSELRSTLDRATGFSMASEAVRVYDAKGDKAARKWLVENIRDNPGLKIDDAKRSGLVEMGLNAIAMRKGENKAQIDANRSSANVLAKAMEDGKPLPQGAVDQAIETAAKLGDVETAAKLLTSKQVYGRNEASRGLSDEERVRLATAAPVVGGVQARIYGRLLQGGLSPVMAFGLMGNLSMESSFNTAARNPGDGRDGSDSIGIAQWNSDRARALSAFAAARGKPVTDVETQADFIVHELGTTEGRARAALQAARTPEEAGRAAIGYFRPAGFSWANPDGAHNSGKRIQQARVLAATLSGASPEAAQAAAQSQFTPEQLAANPYLASTWLKSQLAGNKDLIDSAKFVISAASNAIDKGNTPDAQTLAGAIQIANQNPEKLGRDRDELIAKIRGMDEAEEAMRSGSAAGSALVQDVMRRAQGAPIFVQMQAEATKAAVERGAKNLIEHPWEEADRRGWAPGIPRQLDFSSVESVRAGLNARLGVAQAISSRTGQPQSVLSQLDLSAVSSIWATGAAIAQQNLANGLAALPAEHFGMVMATKEMRDSLIGMSRSGDPAKMATAFSLMDMEQRRDPDGFNKLYGRDVENRMATWMIRSQYMTADQLAKEEARYNDPAMQKARETLRETAMTATKKLTVSEIAGYIGGSWIPFAGAGAPATPAQSQRLVAEYREEYAATFAEVGDEAKSRELAVQRIGRVWGVSSINNGTLMRFPPERGYQTINGSHDWLAKQLDDDIRQSFAPATTPVSEWDLRPPSAPGSAPDGRRPTVTERRRAADAKSAMTPEQRAEVERVEAMINAPRMLVPDARTEAEYQAGQPPSYPIVLKAPNGMFVPLQDAQGRQLRFRGDMEAALAPMRERAGARLRELQTDWQANDATYDRLTADAQRKRAARLARREAQQ